MKSFKIALAQFSPHIGNIDSNAQRMVEQANEAKKQNADLIIFPELSVIGYPAEDLLLRPNLNKRMQKAFQQLKEVKDIVMVFGFVHQTEEGHRYNSAAVMKDGVVLGVYNKHNLPNYSVFDEKRYFSPGHQHLVFEYLGHKFGVLICEDIWSINTVKQLSKLNVETVLVLNASPYEVGKPQHRVQTLTELSKQLNVHLVYLNQVGGQDDLIFDGSSFIINHDGEVAFQAPSFKEELYYSEFDIEQKRYKKIDPAPALDTIAEIYQSLVMATRDYVQRSGFSGVILGLSGGIDSALTLAIAADAIGADKVQAVMMPYTYTSQISVEDATEQARRMGVTFGIAEIHPIVNSFMQTLYPFFGNAPADATEENLQARARGTLLMGLSNKFGNLVLSTGNKSELAVGYCTLYGDMVGGFAVLKDVYKTIVFELAKYRNTLSETPVIPERVITRPPSAELRPDQKDQDSLPAYDILDAILYAYIEEDQSQSDIIAKGFDKEVVEKVIRLVDRNEYKRRQGAIGPRISSRAFSRERRYPIVNGWRPDD
ncbi:MULTISPECIES: NAD+ synthase [Acinetobacter]|uniref:Glutamine-dependent NAD(+) synthetase n=1 Tax=Acinetobacter baylyi (strain ATCC 33305 / BD413 / ADP1) TaxID=62977 RepID=NADE_ACIAD|nr:MULTISPECIES: NAD+ synthase [Acinetobacter]Q6F8K4.1 RecName: Full=Glutamine-dependent NAD(+) synthetase; AltName: Full=NAD synthetase; AltName: Full=NAD(+) synthase [glutamine-hydrolyzing] [Acinetobacter baylyi ADP1]ENV53287.1 NAD+ synthetase [Acinetobacter baylyi DSM 14961 = CIP 107474]KAF2370349.1 NAD+ synthase [Acinetobacter baylyi]KAF2372795.1 NAD+ synthase [Acinetobacter baylyi]KAF2376882.1 NAD+ synthase [Acinetobacter baylyi]KAF2379815.1 NAD+ synthase [Acinetobacter baylyi]